MQSDPKFPCLKELALIAIEKVKTRFGDFLLAATERGLCAVGYPGEHEDFFKVLDKRFVSFRFQKSGKLAIMNCERACEQLQEFFEGRRTAFELEYDLDGTAFERKVWNCLENLPHGSLTTYKDLADKLGTKGYQAVGRAVGKNPVPIFLPCHRVIGMQGQLTGYAGGLPLKRALLDFEKTSAKEHPKRWQ